MISKCAVGFIENGSTVKLPDGRTGIKERECEGSYAGKVIIRLSDNSTLLTDWCAVVEQVAEAARERVA
jgi:hypothetical protein